jgi:hypothetical protein
MKAALFESVASRKGQVSNRPIRRSYNVAVPPQVTADVRGKVNLTSLAQFANCPGDLNLDRVVDDADFVVFVQAYDVLVRMGRCCRRVRGSEWG